MNNLEIYNMNKYKTDKILDLYSQYLNITKATKKYCKEEGIDYDDSIRRYFSTLLKKAKVDHGYLGYKPKILIYDIETSQVTAKMWWSGTQFVSGKRMLTECKIISISWKWLGEDKIYDVAWDTDHNDKSLMEKFLPIYNSADMIIGVNNDRFDNRIVNARAIKHGLDVNLHVKSFDIQKETKRITRLPSYSMDYVAKFLGITHKQSHEGIKMWDMIEDGTPKEQKEYLKKMIDYNRGDIITTEEWYIKMRKYMGHKTHLGVLVGKPKWTCPNCGGTNIVLVRTYFTVAGTVKRVMKCLDDDVQFLMSNTNYIKWIQSKQEVNAES